MKFSERWRQLLDVDPANGQPQNSHSVIQEFINSGLSDISKDAEYGDDPRPSNPSPSSTSLYANQVNTSRHGIPAPYVDLFQNTHMTDDQIRAEISHFHEYVNDLAMVLTFGLKSIKNYRNMYQIEGS